MIYRQRKNTQGIPQGQDLTGSHQILRRENLVGKFKENEPRGDCALGVEGSGQGVPFSPASPVHNIDPGTCLCFLAKIAISE